MNLCKPSTCNFTYPILETECIGSSLSSINYNFAALDTELCTAEQFVTRFTSVYTHYTSLSSKIDQMLSLVSTNSSCWQNTYSTVSQLSAFWLTPITLIYPYKIASGGTTLALMQNWLNANFPPRTGNCFNFIVGQEIYILTPEFVSAQKTRTETVTDTETQTGAGTSGTPGGTFNTLCTWDNICTCIGQGTTITSHSKPISYTCRGQAATDGATAIAVATATATANVTDEYLEKFVGAKFVLQSDFTWGSGVLIF
jgi:hypothetical protein